MLDQSTIPAVAENDNNIPISPTENGLNTVSTIADAPSEFRPSVRLKTVLEQYVRISIIPERTTDGVKPVTAIKPSTVAKTTAA